MEIKKEGDAATITISEKEISIIYRAFSSLSRSVFSGLTVDERALFIAISGRLLEIKTGRDLNPRRRP